MFAPLENTCAYPTGSITKGTVSFFKHVPPIGRFGMSSVRTALAWRSQRVKGRKRENCWRTGQSDAVQFKDGQSLKPVIKMPSEKRLYKPFHRVFDIWALFCFFVVNRPNAIVKFMTSA